MLPAPCPPTHNLQPATRNSPPVPYTNVYRIRLAGPLKKSRFFTNILILFIPKINVLKLECFLLQIFHWPLNIYCHEIIFILNKAIPISTLYPAKKVGHAHPVLRGRFVPSWLEEKIRTCLGEHSAKTDLFSRESP
jgi:hypothetical protein